jgi:hypothetical protein
MFGNHPRLRRLDELTDAESCLAEKRRDALTQFLDAIAGLDHDEPFSPEIERLHTTLITISIEHDLVLAKATAELHDRLDELGTQLVNEAEALLRDA